MKTCEREGAEGRGRVARKGHIYTHHIRVEGQVCVQPRQSSGQLHVKSGTGHAKWFEGEQSVRKISRLR